MSFAYAADRYNQAFDGQNDKVGRIIMFLRDKLVATGRWQVGGSGSGAGGLVQRRGQTAGLGGLAPWDVLTGATGGNSTVWDAGAGSNSISRIQAWILLEELDGSAALTGRAFCISRALSNGTGNDTSVGISWVLGGYATTGATATAPPAAAGGATQGFLIGSSHASPSAWVPSGGTKVGSLQCGNNTANWVHLAIEAAPGADNVLGFQLVSYSRTNGVDGLALCYRPMTRVSTVETFPAVVSAGGWANCFGDVNQAAAGPFYVAATNLRAGSLLANATFERGRSPAFAAGADIPGTSFAPARADNTVVTSGVEVWTSAGQMGILKDCFVNPHNRSYPTTYNVAGSSPRVTYGQLITEWVMGISPNSSP